MKLSHLLEAETPPTQKDLDFSIVSIKQVKADLDELAKKDAYNPETKEKAADKRKAQGAQDSIEEAHWRMDFAIKFHDTIIPEVNEIKARINKAFDDKDINALKKAQQELKTLVVKYDLIKVSKRVNHRHIVRYKVERGYPALLVKKIDWILNLRDSMPKYILRAGRTDSENAKSDKASAAMKARWGSML